MLIRKYGRASDVEVAVPTDCAAKLAACIRGGSAQVEMEWDFPKGDSIKLEVPKRKQDGAAVAIDLSYATPDVWTKKAIKKSPALGKGL
jgi:hypothetical protein